MFGPITVEDISFSGAGVARCLLLRGQVQGGSLLEPPAADVDPALPVDAPGPCAESPYTLGWLLAGIEKPNGSGVMVGLGSGAGAVQLIHNFPQIDLTIVEIDPVIVQVALDTYPLLEFYMDRGRIQIEIGDACQYLAGRYEVWDYGFADGYTGSTKLVTDYLPALCDRADTIFVNAIDRWAGPMLRHIAQVMRDRSKPFRQVFRALPPSAMLSPVPPPLNVRSNYIMTSVNVDLGRAAEFQPYCQEQMWRSFLGQAMIDLASGVT